MGGASLYTKEKFDASGIKLNFIKMRNFEYQQFGKKFVPNLSILDALMFNDSKAFKRALLEYDLV
jgi:hypothetical protein